MAVDIILTVMGTEHMLDSIYSKKYCENQLIKGVHHLSEFSHSECVRYIEIRDLKIAEFSRPEFDDEGKFVGGPTAFRAQYEKFVQHYLNGIKNPCLYMFELVSPDVEMVADTYRAYIRSNAKLNGPGKRACSAMKKTHMIIEGHPQVLYIGKSEKPIDGRIAVHFGYYEGRVSGLHLVHWGKEIGLHLKLHVYELLSPNIQIYLEVIEKICFIRMRPIIGRR